MPLEVNEIGLNMRVRDNPESKSEQPEVSRDDSQDLNREELVDDCVRRVLQILKTQGGR